MVGKCLDGTLVDHGRNPAADLVPRWNANQVWNLPVG
jgi:hypothetical protein